MDKKLILLSYFVILTGCYCSHAQTLFTLKGHIVADSIETREVNVVNLTRKTGVVASKGNFELPVEIGDELFFSSLQYEPYQLTVTQKLVEKDMVQIYLFLLVNELETVRISDLNLTGDLSKDVANTEVNAYFDPAKKGLPVNKKPPRTLAQRRLYTATTSPGGIIPLDPIINAISGRLKMLERQEDYEILETRKEKALRAMPFSFFTKDLQLPADYVEDFIYYCLNFKPFSKLVVQRTQRFALIEFFKVKVIPYKTLKQID